MAFRDNSFLTESFERVVTTFYEEVETTANPKSQPKTDIALIENAAEINATAQDIVKYFDPVNTRKDQHNVAFQEGFPKLEYTGSSEEIVIPPHSKNVPVVVPRFPPGESDSKLHQTGISSTRRDQFQVLLPERQFGTTQFNVKQRATPIELKQFGTKSPETDGQESQRTPTRTKACDTRTTSPITKLNSEVVRETTTQVYLRTQNPWHTVDFEWCVMDFSRYINNVRSVFSVQDCRMSWQASIELITHGNDNSAQFEFVIKMLSKCENAVSALFDLEVHNTKDDVCMRSESDAIFDDHHREHLCFKAVIPASLKPSDNTRYQFKIYDDELIIKGHMLFTGCCVSTSRFKEPKLKRMSE